MAKEEDIKNLAEALVAFLDENSREYIMFFPVSEEEKFIATHADVASVIGFIFTLVKAYKIPIENITPMLNLIDEQEFVDIAQLKG